ncbi:hypothetical protein CLUG_02885 [Clavispora lusitaniae ATCC 42720]|uniref:F-box domain-containing protein n=2 Tax=Clavispora lusitaniae TaxID=36911 RepID=C4Y2X2_CLAL4|nr:uncharacterized protein CLUG_02885 [Clavispora lusitaniae ATCC 42720]EEQ38759.1 hypothetical protein CLUG_02885 [Clavispora lusitaniae ATCC 42720]
MMHVITIKIRNAHTFCSCVQRHMEGQKKSAGTCLNHDVLKIICGHLCQKDLVAFVQTCKEWRSVGSKHLYSHLYVTDKVARLPENAPESLPKPSKWAIVYNSLHDSSCSLKLLERTLGESPSLASLVEELHTDDTVFVLFKLQNWARRFFSDPSCSLRSVHYCNVPIAHFLVGYDSLCAFYQTTPGLGMLTTIQAKNIQDLSHLAHIAKESNTSLNIRKISFCLTDTSSHEITPFDEEVKKVFSDVSRCQVISSSDWALRFLKNLHESYGESLFPSVKHLELTHVHGGPSNSHGPHDESKEVKLDFGILKNLFSISQLESLDCRIGCSHVPVVTGVSEESDFESVYEAGLDCCMCLHSFLTHLKNNLSPSLRYLCLERRGSSFCSNPYSTYQFKRELADLFANIRETHGLRTLILDSKSELVPPWGLHLDDDILIKSINHANTLLMRSIRGLGVDDTKIIDDIEGFVVWEEYSKGTNLGSMEFTANHCSECMETYQDIMDFVSVNAKIQFYLDPTYKKSLSEFYYDLFGVLLLVLRNPMFAQVMFKESSRHGNSESERSFNNAKIANFLPSCDEISSSMGEMLLSGCLSLHDLFRHDSYLDLVVRNGYAHSKRTKIPCKCKGNEVQRFVKLLMHSQHGIK